MKPKIVLVGGLVHYVTAFVASMLTAMVTHQGILEDVYKATTTFWRPELRIEPPDMAALMPLWITTGLLVSFVTAAIYSVFRSALNGPGWQRGLKFGFATGLLYAGMHASLYGVFDLPAFIWLVWALEGIVLAVLAGAALGAVAQKLD
ncbi:MAG: hypothetical protein NW204_08005 [Xanthomonadaceae bacterium]|nr:hypothetical protein [Xanthomonadaceae bacterium]